MSETTKNVKGRREFLKDTARLGAVAALAGVAIPHVHAGEDNTIRLALIGCGGRGSGAAANATSAGGLVMDNRYRSKDEENAKSTGPVKLVAMADLFQDRMDRAHGALEQSARREDGRAQGSAIRGLRRLPQGDRLPAARRRGDLDHALGLPPHALGIRRGKGRPRVHGEEFRLRPRRHAAGAPRGRSGAEKERQNRRRTHVPPFLRAQALIQKMRDGAMGDIQLIRAYRMDGGYRMGPFKGGENELLFQIRHAYLFLWTTPGIFIELMIHQIDECCWIKDSWPVTAHGVGGRVAGSTDCSQNLDAYSIEYTFADGTKALVTGRYTPNCFNDFVTYAHGTKCAAQFSGNIHAPSSQIYKDQRILENNVAWKPKRERVNPWQAEWNSFLSDIRNDRPHNEARRAALSNLAAIMGRAAVHMGKVITWDEMMASKFTLCPNVAGLTNDSPAPVRADAQGRYPAPIPGACTEI